MKTAISLDGQLLGEADRVARAMGLSRSRLISLALEAYLRRLRHEEITEQLNRVYAGTPDAIEQSTRKKMKAKFRATLREGW
jgi:metal-responsive CopG/Arc/MetJ family transcriptional regulator